MKIKDRILGLDYGQKRIGISISDPLHIIAQPLCTLEGLKQDQIIIKISEIVTEYDVKTIVVGNPLTMKGEIGSSAERVRCFADTLENRIQIRVILWDERLTSRQAHRILHQMDRKPSRMKAKVDLIASGLILENYLDFLNNPNNNIQGEEI